MTGVTLFPLSLMYRHDISLSGICQSKRNGRFRGRTMRWRGLEPPRGFNPTRPSTLRVYQFRHQRARRIVAAATVRSHGDLGGALGAGGSGARGSAPAPPAG